MRRGRDHGVRSRQLIDDAHNLWLTSEIANRKSETRKRPVVRPVEGLSLNLSTSLETGLVEG